MKVNLFLACLLGTKKMAIKAWYWSWNKNKFVNYKHFKMVSINNVINLIKLNVYMTSIYLKDAFFSVPIQIIIKSILCLEICFNLHPCLMAMDFLWEYLLKYQKYLLDIWEAQVTTQLYMKLIHISKERDISLALLPFKKL